MNGYVLLNVKVVLEDNMDLKTIIYIMSIVHRVYIAAISYAMWKLFSFEMSVLVMLVLLFWKLLDIEENKMPTHLRAQRRKAHTRG